MILQCHVQHVRTSMMSLTSDAHLHKTLNICWYHQINWTNKDPEVRRDDHIIEIRSRVTSLILVSLILLQLGLYWATWCHIGQICIIL